MKNDVIKNAFVNFNELTKIKNLNPYFSLIFVRMTFMAWLKYTTYL